MFDPNLRLRYHRVVSPANAPKATEPRAEHIYIEEG